MLRILHSDHPFIGLTYWCLRKIIGPVIRIVLVKKIEGIEHIPKHGAALVAFNHQSFFDFLCFASVSPRNIHFLSAEKFFEHKVWRILMILTGQIRVNRKSSEKKEVHDSVVKHVRNNSLIGIFPEGTRSPYKDEMLKAFTGVAQFALKHHIPVIPIGITGTYEIMSKDDKFPKAKKIVKIIVGKALDFKEYHDKHTEHDICTHVTETVMKQIEILCGKKYKHYESKFFQEISSN